MALGLFIGCLPVYGLHGALCVSLCLAFGLDTAIAYLAANISNPIVAPFLLALEYELGSWLLSGRHLSFQLQHFDRAKIPEYARELMLGGVLVGALFALAGGFGMWWVARRWPKTQDSPLARAIALTRACYRRCHPRDRIYVAIKLKTDPLLAALLRQAGDYGTLIDAGCGRGQFGIALLCAGRAAQVIGFDTDPRKIDAASRAQPQNAQFSVGASLGARWPLVDSVFIFDVLHYLAPIEQADLLKCAVAALKPGGRLLVRDLDARPGFRAWFTRNIEKIGKALGFNRARAAFYFRPSAEIVQILEQLGLSCTVEPCSENTPFGNVLIVGQAVSVVRGALPLAEPSAQLAGVDARTPVLN